MRAFKDARALVTGASSGIGRAIALALAAEGATVLLVGRRAEALAEVAEQAAAAGGAALALPADLTVEHEVTALAARAGDELDILVHAAGVYGRGPLASAPVAALDAQYRTNVRAAWMLTQALLPRLRPWRSQVVFVNSTAGLRAGAAVGAYAASKHALRALADALRDEINPLGIRVLSVFVGRTATPMQEAVHAAEGRPYDPAGLLQPADVAAVVTHALALPRTAEVTELTIRPLRAA